MKVEHWLRSNLVIKMRNRLSSWVREDFIAFAEIEFGTTELTKIQVSELVEKLKHPEVKKPPREISQKYRLDQTTSEVPLEVVFKTNSGTNNFKETHWYLSDKKANIRFSSDRDCVAWAFTLIRNFPKDSWSGITFRWKEMTKLNNFNPAEIGFSDILFNQDLLKKLKTISRSNYKMTTPLPDSESIEKQYWALQEGDVLTNKDSSIIVKQVRSNLDGPPTVVFEKVKL